MPVGLSIPVGVGSSGGAKLSTGDDNDHKIIMLALGSDDNDNAFQQNIGLGEDIVFDIANESVQATITRRLIEMFRRFQAQQRYILRTETISWDYDSANQVMFLSFKYVQVESDKEQEFRQQFSSGQVG